MSNIQRPQTLGCVNVHSIRDVNREHKTVHSIQCADASDETKDRRQESKFGLDCKKKIGRSHTVECPGVETSTDNRKGRRSATTCLPINAFEHCFGSLDLEKCNSIIDPKSIELIEEGEYTFNRDDSFNSSLSIETSLDQEDGQDSGLDSQSAGLGLDTQGEAIEEVQIPVISNSVTPPVETSEELKDRAPPSPNPSKPDEINVHKPLKDLIHRTNRSYYQVDSNKVRHRVGLSKRTTALPHLHPKLYSNT